MEKLVLDSPSVERAIVRMAHEILEKNKSAESLALIGIHTRGVVLANRLQQALQTIAQTAVPVGILDINLYRDDLTKVAEQPIIHKTEINFDLENKTAGEFDNLFGKALTAIGQGETDSHD